MSPAPIAFCTRRFWDRVQKGDGCWTWTGAISTPGYGVLNHVYAHRTSYEMHHGAIPAGVYVLHRCDNRICVRPDHLFLGTHADNLRDMHRKGRSNFQVNPALRPHGERVNTAKLTPELVHEIRRRTDKGCVNLAREYGVSSSTIKAIRNRRIWKHLPEAA